MSNILKRLLRSSFGYLLFWGIIVILLVFVKPDHLNSAITKIFSHNTLSKEIEGGTLHTEEILNNDIELTAPRTVQEQSYIYVYQDGRYVAIPSEPIN